MRSSDLSRHPRFSYLAAFMLACGPAGEPKSADAPALRFDTATPAIETRPPRIGLAVTDTLGRWCAEFAIDSAMPSLGAGQPVTLVFAGEAPLASLRSQVNSPKEGECPSAFPQPRWFDYEAFWVTPADSFPTATTVPGVALIVTGHQLWVRDTGAVVRGDLDGDGRAEEARRCTADEGEHFTVWSRRPDGTPVRWGHEYYDWGGFTDPTCRPEEMAP